MVGYLVTPLVGSGLQYWVGSLLPKSLAFKYHDNKEPINILVLP
jgi:hypothetical protein